MTTNYVFFAQSAAADSAAEKTENFFDVLKSAFPSWTALLMFLALVVVGIFAGKFLKRALIALSGKAQNALRGRGEAAFIVVNAFFRTFPLAFFAAGIFVYRFFLFPQDGVPATEETGASALLLHAGWIVVIVAQTQLLWHLVQLPMFFLRKFLSRRQDGASTATLIPLVGAALQALVVFWGILLVVRAATGTPPAEVLAMIGIGGLAIGLASQDTVKNFFGTAMLVIDSPFAVGDYIDIGTGTPGTVVRIGLRSTRLRTSDDHAVSIPNGDLANRIITTISAREKIRRVMNLGLTYDTPPEKVEEAVRIISSVLNDSGKLAEGSQPSVFFSDFTDSALNIRVIYSFGTSDVAAANAFAHETNLEILRRFNAAGISFAFPTQTIELKKPA